MMVLLLHSIPPLAGERDMVGYSETEKALQRTPDCEGPLFEFMHGHDPWSAALLSWGWRA